MIPHEDQGFSPVLRRLPLQIHQQVENLAHVGTPVDDVPRLHESGGATRPLVGLVDQVGGAENRNQAVVGAMDVPDGHDSARRLISRPSSDTDEQAPETYQGHHCPLEPASPRS